MKDNYIDFNQNKDYTLLKHAGEIIKNGGLVLFPTETVYGIGANGLNSDSVAKIFAAKGRKSDNPLILHISDIKMLADIVEDITPLEERLMSKFWPGPLTIILRKKDIVPSIVTANLNTVGIRMPNNEIARKLIEYAGVPIAAPSANISGRPSGTNINDIKEEFAGKVDCIIDGGETNIGLESTVVIVQNEKVKILRPGKVTKEDLLTITPNVEIDSHILSKPESGPVLSPGMKYQHYAPKTKCILIYSHDNFKLIKEMQNEANKWPNSLLITREENLQYFSNAISYGSSLEEISHNIFKILRQVDKENVDMIIIEGVAPKGLGLAIMNRLLRACSYNYKEV